MKHEIPFHLFKLNVKARGFISSMCPGCLHCSDGLKSSLQLHLSLFLARLLISPQNYLNHVKTEQNKTKKSTNPNKKNPPFLYLRLEHIEAVAAFPLTSLDAGSNTGDLARPEDLASRVSESLLQAHW